MTGRVGRGDWVRAQTGGTEAEPAAAAAVEAHPVSTRLLGRPPNLLDRAAARASTLPRNAHALITGSGLAVLPLAILNVTGDAAEMGAAGVSSRHTTPAAAAWVGVEAALYLAKRYGPTRNAMLTADRHPRVDRLLPVLDDVDARLRLQGPGVRNPIARHFEAYGPVLSALTGDHVGDALHAFLRLASDPHLNAALALSNEPASADDENAVLATVDMARVKGHAVGLLRELAKHDAPGDAARIAAADRRARSFQILDDKAIEASSSAGQFWLRAWGRQRPDAAVALQAMAVAYAARREAGLSHDTEPVIEALARVLHQPDADRLAMAESPICAALLAGHTGPAPHWHGLLEAEQAPRAREVAALIDALLAGTRPRHRDDVHRSLRSLVGYHPAVLVQLGGDSAVDALLAGNHVASTLLHSRIPFKPARAAAPSLAMPAEQAWRRIEGFAIGHLKSAADAKRLTREKLLAAIEHIHDIAHIEPASQRLEAIEDATTQNKLPGNQKAFLHATRAGRIVLEHLERWHGDSLPDHRELVLAQQALDAVATAPERHEGINFPVVQHFVERHRGRAALEAARATPAGRDAVAMLFDNFTRHGIEEMREDFARHLEDGAPRFLPEAMRAASADPAVAFDGAGHLASDARLNWMLRFIAPEAIDAAPARLDSFDPAIQAGHALSLVDGLRADHPDLLNEGQLSRAYLHLARRDAPADAIAQAAGLAGDVQLDQLETLAQRPPPSGSPSAASVALWRRVLAERHPDLPDDPDAYALLMARKALADANLSGVPGLDAALRAQLRSLHDEG